MILWMGLWAVGAIWIKIHVHRHYLNGEAAVDPKRGFFNALELICIAAAGLPSILVLCHALPVIFMLPILLLCILAASILAANILLALVLMRKFH